MMLEWLLAVLHVSAFIALIVFLSGQISLCRVQWWNDAVLQRLQRLNRLYWGSVVTVLLTGLMRAIFGIKGWYFYEQQPIFWLKLVAFLAVVSMSLRVNRAYRHWMSNPYHSAQEIDRIRRWMMIQAHLIMLFPILGLMMAYGLGLK